MKYWKPIVLVLWGATLLFVFYIVPKEERLQKDTLDHLVQENKSLHYENQVLDKDIQQLQKAMDSLVKHIALSHNIIKTLEIRRNENLDKINTMSAMELQQYFTRFKTDSTNIQKH